MTPIHDFQPDPHARDYCRCGAHRDTDIHPGYKSPEVRTLESEVTRLKAENERLKAELAQAQRLDEARLEQTLIVKSQLESAREALRKIAELARLKILVQASELGGLAEKALTSREKE